MSRIDNLGDYNTVRKALQAAGGNAEKLYKTVGDTAVAKAAPKLLFKGGAIGVGIIGVFYAGHKGIKFMKDRKLKIANEPELKKNFVDAIESDLLKDDNVISTDCDVESREDQE
ncbi:MAG: hypothetical protein GX028_04820 [Clostridiaceae bacterium]|nr:hypothetical protein [Clostridiaceae bacterium]